MKIITKRRVEVTRYWTREFDLIGGHGRGYSFECNERGGIDIDALAPSSMTALAKVTDNREYRDRTVEHTKQTTHPAIGECEECKRTVPLLGWTNTCDGCGVEYNSFGQRLTARRFWGEETGEHPSDLGNIR